MNSGLIPTLSLVYGINCFTYKFIYNMGVVETAAYQQSQRDAPGLFMRKKTINIVKKTVNYIGWFFQILRET